MMGRCGPPPGLYSSTLKREEVRWKLELKRRISKKKKIYEIKHDPCPN
jgi:hypothetical protein